MRLSLLPDSHPQVKRVRLQASFRLPSNLHLPSNPSPTPALSSFRNKPAHHHFHHPAKRLNFAPELHPLHLITCTKIDQKLLNILNNMFVNAIFIIVFSIAFCIIRKKYD